MINGFKRQFIFLILVLICFTNLVWAIPAHITQKSDQLSFNFHDIPVRELLELLAEIKGFNLIVSDEVQGNVTLHLQDITWSQALDSILAMEGLGQRRQGNILLVAPVAQLAQYSDQIQETKNLTSELVRLHYAKAADVAEIIQNKSSDLLSSRGSLNADPRSNQLWIKDTPDRLEQIHRFLRGIDVAARQVHIAARIVHMDQDYMEDLGLKFGTSTNEQSAVTAMNPGHLNFAIAHLGASNSLDLELLALAKEGHAEILAKPELITENRQLAEIESGEEIPYQQGTSSGATDVTFKKAVLGLKVTPEISLDNKILLNLKVNQDQVSALTVNGVPAISTQEITTQILAGNGETIVLGGILEESKNKVQQRLPFISTIPWLGKLFSSKETQNQRKELLIFITPTILS